MKILVIGDVHGRNTWKNIVSINKDSNYVVFLGDYFDSYNKFSPLEEFTNYLDIIRFFHENSERVHLLIGNHDHHYTQVNEAYSGYDNRKRILAQKTLLDHIKEGIIKPTFQIDNILFSHAGVGKVWSEESADIHSTENISTKINELYIHKPYKFNFNGINMYGDNVTQGPLWIRPNSLFQTGWKDLIQVVGHTKIATKPINLPDSNIWMCDCLEDSGYLVIQDKEFIPQTLINE